MEELARMDDEVEVREQVTRKTRIRRRLLDPLAYVPPIELPAETPYTGRNQPCPCGSGRKFKKCCGG